MKRTILVCFVVLASCAPSELHAALPDPPKQHEPWQPPPTAATPAFVVNVAAQLFTVGLADPRDGAYRSAEIYDSSPVSGTVHTHAWVFPGQFAVCWNGLVYRVKSAGALADLDADVRTILSAKPWSGRLPTVFRAHDDGDHADAMFWSDLQTNQTIVPASIALLLRLGRADLAWRLWAAPEEPTLFGKQVSSRESEEGLWLATSAIAWFGTAYWRLVGAFGKGDDQGAADIGESVLEWRARAPDSWRVENHWSPKRIPDISFLDPVPEIVADARRRLRESKHESAMPGIDELIGRLEDVEGTKISIPGPLVFSFDPIYKALVQKRDAAVPALINAYESDKRLTRTFDYSRPWYIEYTPVTVHMVIGSILDEILGDPTWKAKSPAELRSWWRDLQTKHQPQKGYICGARWAFLGRSPELRQPR